MQNTTKLQSFLERKRFEHLGAGCFSSVFGKPGSDKVVKLNKPASPDAWSDYVLWAARNGFMGGLAPRVHSLRFTADGAYVAVVERLAMTQSKLMYLDAIKTPEQHMQLEACAWLYRRLKGWEAVDAKVPEQYAPYLPDGERFIRAWWAAGFHNKDPDVHEHNIMLRTDGTIVVNDPFGFGGRLSTDTPRVRSTQWDSLRSAA